MKPNSTSTSLTLFSASFVFSVLPQIASSPGFDSDNLKINVIVALANLPQPSLPTLSFKDPIIANYVSLEMLIGFSASKTEWIEAQRVLAWNFSHNGVAKEINMAKLLVFELKASSKSLSKGAIIGITIGCAVFVVILAYRVYLYWRKKKLEDEEDEIEDWEMEYWPHQFSNKELSEATDGSLKDHLLGSSGVGKVYRGILSNKMEIAVNYVNHGSKQGLREFMVEISSMGRLQHKNLVQMRGWCRKGN